MVIGIIGTRTPEISYRRWVKLLLLVIDKRKIEDVISGGAKGVDSYVRRFTSEYSLPLFEFFPFYSKYGRKAPLIRNIEIIDASDIIIAFPSQNSRGTYHAIREAVKRNVPVVVINI